LQPTAGSSTKLIPLNSPPIFKNFPIFTHQNRYLYNGKEYQDDFGLNWYDYGARFYDPQIARWHSVDPLAELYFHITPYRYGLNNPIRFADALGLTEEERMTALSHLRLHLRKSTAYSTMDCSALVGSGLIAAGKQNYKNVSGIGEWQGGVPRIVNMSRPINRESMLPGDVVTFSSGRNEPQGPDGIYDHVGMVSELIYHEETGKLIGFKFIHSSSGRGKVVEDRYLFSNASGIKGYVLSGIWAWEYDEEDKLYHGFLDEAVISADAPKRKKHKRPIPQVRRTGAQQGRKVPGEFGYIGSYWDTYDSVKSFGRDEEKD
jgi:RHS repeat-associated protein